MISDNQQHTYIDQKRKFYAFFQNYEIDIECRCCEDCGQYTYDCHCDPEYANDPFEEDEDLDDTDGESQSWLCPNCGDPAYDCGCMDEPQGSDLEDEIDRKAELMEHGRI